MELERRTNSGMADDPRNRSQPYCEEAIKYEHLVIRTHGRAYHEETSPHLRPPKAPLLEYMRAWCLGPRGRDAF
jgi:hypothetical protein